MQVYRALKTFSAVVNYKTYKDLETIVIQGQLFVVNCSDKLPFPNEYSLSECYEELEMKVKQLD